MQEFDEHIDSNLKQLPVAGGFRVPEGYFDDLKVLVSYQTVFQQTQVEEEPMAEGYFESSRQQILAKTIPSKSIRISFWSTAYAKPLSLAASVILVAGVLFWLYKPQQTTVVYPQLSEDEIIGYLQQDALREVPVEEVVKLVPVSEIIVETDEEEYLILETL